MSTGAVIAIVVIAVVVIGGFIAWQAYRKREQEGLKEQFGPEYERTVRETGDPNRAGTILKERVQRVQALNIVPLDYKTRDEYASRWKEVQSEFVDDPAGAIEHADDLVQEVMQKRGYPVGEFDQRVADISVDHSDVAEHYRTAHDIALRQENGDSNTEELRTAMIHYRALFEDLLRPETSEVRR